MRTLLAWMLWLGLGLGALAASAATPAPPWAMGLIVRLKDQGAAAPAPSLLRLQASARPPEFDTKTPILRFWRRHLYINQGLTSACTEVL